MDAVLYKLAPFRHGQQTEVSHISIITTVNSLYIGGAEFVDAIDAIQSNTVEI